ncbi:MAG: acetoacetate--CoA ligase [Nocardioidaceae bacterium]
MPAQSTHEVLWSPPANVRATTRIGRYLGWLERQHGLVFDDYAGLWQWSVDEPDAFWLSVWQHFGLPGSPQPVVALPDPSMPGTHWFPGLTLNYAQAMLDLPGRDDDDVVVIGLSQSREHVDLTAAQLRDLAGRARVGLQRLGVARGDRVAVYAPNIPETLILLLATASLGATFSSCAPEFGTRSVVDRWTQIEPKVLVAVDGYRYGDKPIDRRREVGAILAALPSVEATVWLPYLDLDSPPPQGAATWVDLVAEAGELVFEPVPFDHPLYVLYSSGTTGLPKPIVHGHGGILVEHVKALALQMDLGPGDRLFWFSTTGWMMWNYLVSGLAVGATVVMYDGNPASPDLGTLWRLVERVGITYFGTSAPFLLACRKAGLVPGETADLSTLRGVGSTGAPLPVEGFRWVYDAVSPSVLLASFSGGTDVCTGFLGGAPILPVYAGEIACRCLGCKVEAYDESGTPVVDQLGELVITAPMPSMPVAFWGDTDGSRLRAAYFEVFPGVWRHGDWITITDLGTCAITGRSDATLNRGGVRLGTAEFYSVVEAMAQVADSLVVHLEDAEGGAGELLLFVVPAEGVTLDDDLRHAIATALRTNLSPRHVPDQIWAVPALPHTLSGKKLEVPVKRILRGAPVDDAAAKGALANPESLDAFEALAARRRG